MNAGPTVTAFTGPAGIGRTHRLQRLRREAVRAGRPVLEVRLAPEDRDVPWYLAGRILAGLTSTPTRLTAGGDRGLPIAPTPAAVAGALRRRRGLVVLIDDAQWADTESASVLLAAASELNGAGLRCFITFRTGDDPEPVVADEFAGLRRAGLACVAPIRPLTNTELDELTRLELQAVPHRLLSAELRRLSRGRPAALLAAIDGLRDAGSLCLADRRAYLTDPTLQPIISANHRMMAVLRRFEPATQAVARALSALEPLGAAVPVLIGEALRMPVEDVAEQLEQLCRSGFVRRYRNGWCLRVPAVRIAFNSDLGPFERARLAQIAAEAVGSGRADTTAAGYLPDQVALAGNLLDATAALKILREHARTFVLESPAAAARWWAAARSLSGDPADHVQALVSRAEAALRSGRYAAARHDLERLLSELDSVASVVPLAEIELMMLTAVRGQRDLYTLRAVIAGQRWPGTGPEPALITRAVALTLLNRWADAAAHISGLKPGEDDDLVAAVVDQIDTVTGRGASARPDAVAAEHTRRTMTVMTERLATDLLRDVPHPVRHGLTATTLPVPERCLLDRHAGRWDDALDGAFFSMAADFVVGRHPLHAVVHRAAAEILTARGRPVRARAVLKAARADEAPLSHLCAVVSAEAERVLGDAAAAAGTVRGGLTEAAECGAVLGTDELYAFTVELAMERGDHRTAAEAATRAAAAASLLGTHASALRAATARLIVSPDGGVAGEVVTLARELGRPYELARTLELVVRWAGHLPGLLTEAYDLLGGLDALVHRSRLRQLMREHRIAVPDRAGTVAEAERLLALLIAEGLSNRELAAATQSSTKSVEGRLSRLFIRTGYRSRVELAAAVLVGDFR